jgi:hypothetical protein
MRFADTFIPNSNQPGRNGNRQTSLRAGRRKPSVKLTALMFESLELREMLSVSPVMGLIGVIGTMGNQLPPPPPTSMTQLAQDMINSGQLAAPSGPTYLYLNCDGWKACKYNGNNDVTAFTGTAGDIASILYRTAEAFAPFDVIVQQISGDGNYSTTTGATTVFIGNSINGNNFTPSDFMDYPHSGGSTTHVVNSDLTMWPSSARASWASAHQPTAMPRLPTLWLTRRGTLSAWRTCELTASPTIRTTRRAPRRTRRPIRPT